MQTNSVQSFDSSAAGNAGVLFAVELSTEKSAATDIETRDRNRNEFVPIRGLDPMKVYAYWMLKDTEWPGACGTDDDVS